MIGCVLLKDLINIVVFGHVELMVTDIFRYAELENHQMEPKALSAADVATREFYSR